MLPASSGLQCIAAKADIIKDRQICHLQKKESCVSFPQETIFDCCTILGSALFMCLKSATVLVWAEDS